MIPEQRHFLMDGQYQEKLFVIFMESTLQVIYKYF
jgi:hypothetical protein